MSRSVGPSRMSASPGRRRRNQDGASAVEFALVLVPLLVVVFGIIQYGFYFYASQVGSSTAREAVRKVAVGDCPGQTEFETFIKNRLGGASQGLISASKSFKKADGTTTTTAEVGGRVTVVVKFQSLDMNFPFVPVFDDGKVTREVDARIEDLTASGACT